MEVTKHNFTQLFNTITSHIKASTFISFDLEFTGLNIHSNLKNTSLDTMQHRYMKLRENVSAFWPLQIGICCFEMQNHKAIVHPYSFYLFPLAIEGSRTYSIQPSSISFLAQHGYNFNKSFIDGITFMNSRDKETLQSLSPEVLAKPYENKVTHEMRAFLELVKDQLKSWDKQEPLRIPTEYIRKTVISYVIKEIECNYDMMCEIEYDTRFCKAIIITPGKREMPMNEIINFSDTIEAMKGKIIMGHNMLLDLMYLHEKFITPLPPRVEDFGAKILEYFPKVLDTKILLQNSSVLKRFVRFTVV
jgi:poly(A)-specific ribonuclease